MPVTDKAVKRQSGITVGERWLVFRESKQRPDGSWRHMCGGQVMLAEIPFSQRWDDESLHGGGEVIREKVPFCPNCEKPPKSGIFIESTGEFVVDSWVEESA